jgi:hypothetical protein
MRYIKISFAILLLLCIFSTTYAQRNVQVIYFKPINAPEVTEKFVDDLQNTLSEVQLFYALEMKRLGYGSKTFRYETLNREIYIYVINGKMKWEDYMTEEDLTIYGHK